MQPQISHLSSAKLLSIIGTMEILLSIVWKSFFIDTTVFWEIEPFIMLCNTETTSDVLRINTLFPYGEKLPPHPLPITLSEPSVNDTLFLETG